ncbi:MAG TPA: hypothetical protein VK639_20800, partial [Terriglobales bacterium]|nr:hypothetical protein [Terriglobales bacterium]
SKAEWLLGFFLTAAIFSLLLVRAFHANALWRDECAAVQLAGMPALSDLLGNFQHEAFPPLFPFIVRIYTILFGSSDTVLRVLGFCVGGLLVGVFWINSRLFRGGIPLVGLGLLSLNTTFFVWGTTIRGYGLGSALIVLMFGCVGSLLLASTPRRGVTAMLVSFFGVQVLLYNSILLIAIVASAAIVFLFQRRFKDLLVVAAICAPVLASLLAYVPAYARARDWNILVRGAPTLYSLWKHFEVALGNPGYSIPALWYSVALGLAGVFIFRTYKNHRGQPVPHRDLIWFAVIVSGLSITGCYLFLRVLSYTTSAWYYLALICLIAAALDLMASSLCTSTWLRLAKLGFGSAALIAAPFADWSAITERQTNVDMAARTVAARAAPGDLIVVAPWQLGIPFQRYYCGAAPWMTIPSIADHRVHRYDLMKAKMISQDPIDDLGKAVRMTLVSGSRVWFVGGLNLPPPEDGPMVLPPAPASRFKWDNRAYTASWWQQLSVFAISHANKVDEVPLSLPESIRINELEQTSLTVVQGWH